MQYEFQTSFAAGEIAPNLYARTDWNKYKVGAALLENFYVDYRGGASNRPGSQFLAFLRNQSPSIAFANGRPRLIPFIIGEQNSYVCVFGQEYIDIYYYGNFVTTLSSPYQMADLPLLKYSQSADTLTLTHPNYQPEELVLNGTTWTLSPITLGATQDPPTGLSVTSPSTSDPDYCYSYVVTAVSADGKSESLPCSPVLQHYTILDETKGYIISLTWDAPTNPVSVYRIYKCGPFDDRASSGAGTIWGYIGSSQTTAFVDNNIAPDFSQTPPLFGDPWSAGQFESITVTSGGSGYPAGSSWTGYIPLTITNTGTGVGSGAAGFAVTNYLGVVTGAFFTSFGKNYSTSGGAGVSITAGSGGATFEFTLSGAAAWPGVSSYFDQRQLFAGSTAKPETVFLSVTGDYFNFNTSPISEASDAIAEDISTSEVNRVTGLIVVAYGLLLFTTGGVYLLSGGTPGAPVTPSSITNNAQASNGSSDLQPIRINYSVLYLQFKGNIVRDCSFAWQRQSYVGADISTDSNHLFFDQTINEWCWAEEPFKLVWACRDDGVMLTMAYEPDEEVKAWSHHNTQGLFKSVTAIPEGNYNVVYVIVLRYFPQYNGGGWFYTLERMDTRTFEYVEDAWFLDCALASPLTTYENFANSAPGYCLASAANGTGVTITAQGPAATAGVFSSAAAGDVFWALGGKAVITAVNSSSEITVTVEMPFPVIEGTTVPVPFRGVDWAYGPVLTTVTGLSMYDGLSVGILVDGVPQPEQVVSGGSITLATPGSKVLVGLPYTSTLKTLQIDFPDQLGSVQTRRKTLTGASGRFYQSQGMLCGIDENDLNEVSWYDDDQPYPTAAPFYSGDARFILTSSWQTQGQVMVQQTQPLPCTVLGISVEVTVGDDIP